MSPVLSKIPEQATLDSQTGSSSSPSVDQRLFAAVDAFNSFMSAYKILPAVSICSSIVNSKGAGQKAAHLLALFDLYASGRGQEMLKSISACHSYVYDLVGVITKAKEDPKEFTAKFANDCAIISQVTPQAGADTPTVSYNPRLDQVSAQMPAPTAPTQPSASFNIKTGLLTVKESFIAILREHLDIVRPALGFLAILAASLGFTGNLSLDWIFGGQGKLAGMAANIKNTNVVWSAVDDISDWALKSIFNMAGETYLPPKAKKYQSLVNTAHGLASRVRDLNTAYRQDTLGAVRTQSIQGVDRDYQELLKQYALLTSEEKSMFSLAPLSNEIFEGIKSLKERRDQLIQTQFKQEPVRVWFYGPPGLGKTYIMTRLAEHLTEENLNSYSRNVADSYWSNYCGQDIIMYDDIAQRSDELDIQEWHAHASSNVTAVSGASIIDKGIAFVSRFMFATSNQQDITKSSVITDPGSFNRRRDFLIYVYNADYITARDNGILAADPAAWYAAHPNRYFLLRPVRKEGAPADAVRGLPSPHDPRVICETTIPQLAEMISELEKARRETYRQALYKNKDSLTALTIPEEPYQFNKNAFDLEAMHRRYVAGVPIVIEPIAQPGEAASQLSQESLFSNTEPQSLQPVTTRVLGKRYAIILEGNAGVGKTYMLDSIVSTKEHRRVDLLKYAQDSVYCAEISAYRGILVADDFTTSEITTAAFAQLIHENYECKLETSVLIATCNSNMPGFQNVKDRYEMVLRRSYYYKLGFSFQGSIALRVKGLKPAEFIPTLSPSDIDAYLSVKSLGKTHKVGSQGSLKMSLVYSTLPSVIHSIMNTPDDIDIVSVTGEFIVPMPDVYDYHVTVAPEVYNLDYRNPMHAIKAITSCKIVDGEGKPCNGAKLVKYLPALMTFTQCNFAAGLSTLTSTFNNQRNCLGFDGTWIIDTGMANGIIGFYAKGNEPTIMFRVDVETPVRIVLNSEGKPFSTSGDLSPLDDPYNAKYTHVLSQLYANPLPNIPTEEQVLHDLVTITPQYKMIVRAGEVIHALLRVGSMITLIKGMFTNGNEPTPTQAHNAHDESLEVGQVHSTVNESTSEQVHNTVNELTQPIVEEKKANTAHVSHVNNGVPVSSKAPAKKNDTTPSLSVAIQDEAITPFTYEQFGPKRQYTRRLVVNEAAAIEGNVVQHANGQYGYVWRNAVICADETSTGQWTVMQMPLTTSWRQIDFAKLPTKLSTVNGAGTYKVRFANHGVDEMSTLSLVGQTISVSNLGTDVGSLIAFAMITGIPYDGEADRLAPSAAVEIFSRADIRAPSALIRLFTAMFPRSADRLNSKVQAEGVYDDAAVEQGVIVAANSVSMTLNGKHHVHALMLKERIGLTVGHCSTEALALDTRTGRQYPVKVIARNRSQDVMLFEIEDPTCASWPSVLAHVISEKDLSTLWTATRGEIGVTLTLLQREHNHRVLPMRQVFAGMRPNVTSSAELAGSSAGYASHIHSFHIDTGVTQPGDCGSPLIVMCPQVAHKWCGIHRAGNAGVSVGVLITKEWITRVLAQRAFVANESADSVMPTPLFPGVTAHSAPTVDEATGLLEVGTIDKEVFLPTQTRMYRTGLLLPEYDTCEPAVLSTQDPRQPGRDMYTEGLARYSKQSEYSIDRVEWADAFQNIGNELANKIQCRGKDVRVFTKTEAINRPSYAEYPMAKPLDRNGSAGYPHIQAKDRNDTSKGAYLVFNPNNQMHYFAPDAEAQRMSSRIDRVVDDAYNGIPHLHPFVAYEKDEVVKFKKIYDVETAKTRIFFSGQFEYLVAYRMCFGSAMQRIMEMHNTIPVKVGISPNMGGWNTLAYRLALKSIDNGMATDVANYDSSIMQEIIEELVGVYQTIYQQCSAPGEDVLKGNRARATLHKAVEGAYVIARDKLYKLRQAMVSGCPGTAIENSFVIWALYAIIWKRLALRHHPDVATYAAFRSNVELAVYGDDNVATVKPGFSWFNFNSFQQEAAKMGFTITDALKLGGDVPDYMPLSQLDFLQRGFEQRGSFYVGALTYKSLGKALHWVHGAKAYNVRTRHVPSLGGAWPVSPDPTRAADAVNGLWPELALRGREEYEKIKQEVMLEAARLHLDVNPPTFREASAMMGYEES